MEKSIYLAGGCFWCIGDYFSSLPYVNRVIVGYSGGDEKTPTYKDVKAQKTGHRETVEVLYQEGHLDELIDEFFNYVDPLDKDGQYIDKGHSYTLAIYYQNLKEKEYFTHRIQELSTKLGKEVYISLEPFKFFVKAEETHQDYGKINPEKLLEELRSSQRTCHLKIKGVK